MVLYYQAVHGRCRLLNRATIWALVVLGVCAFATIWMSMPDIALLTAGSVIAAMSFWVLIAGCAGKSAAARAIAEQCAVVASELAALFARLDALDEDCDERTTRTLLDGLKGRLVAATYRSGDAGLRDNERINERATAAATEDMLAGHA